VFWKLEGGPPGDPTGAGVGVIFAATRQNSSKLSARNIMHPKTELRRRTYDLSELPTCRPALPFASQSHAWWNPI